MAITASRLQRNLAPRLQQGSPRPSTHGLHLPKNDGQGSIPAATKKRKTKKIEQHAREDARPLFPVARWHGNDRGTGGYGQGLRRQRRSTSNLVGAVAVAQAPVTATRPAMEEGAWICFFDRSQQGKP